MKDTEMKHATLEFIREDFGIMLLDMIDTARRDNDRQGVNGRCVYDDYDYRCAAAVVAQAFGYTSRAEWTDDLKRFFTEYRHDINDTDTYYRW